MQSLQDAGQTVGADVVEEVGVVDNEESVTTGNDTDLVQSQGTADLTGLQQGDMGGTTISQHDLQNSALTDPFTGAVLDQSMQQTLNQQVWKLISVFVLWACFYQEQISSDSCKFQKTSAFFL